MKRFLIPVTRKTGGRERKRSFYGFLTGLGAFLFAVLSFPSSKIWAQEEIQEQPSSPFQNGYLSGQVHLGFQPYWIQGNPYKFWEYHRPSPSPYARHLSFQGEKNTTFLEIRVNQPGWLPFSTEIQGGWSTRWRNQFFVGYQQNEFYPRWNPDPQNRILREITWTSRHLETSLRIKGTYRLQSQASTQKFLNLQDFHSLPAYTVQNFSLEGTLPLGSTNLNFSHQTSWFRDRHPFTMGKANEQGPTLSSLNLELEKPFGGSVEALFYLNLLSGDIPGKAFQVRDQLRKAVFGADLVATPSSHLSLRGRFRRSALRRSTVGLGYFKGGKTETLDLDYRPLKTFFLRGGFEIQNQEFVNRSGETNTPSWRNWWVMARIKPSSRIQFSFRWSDKEVKNIPSRPEDPLSPSPFPPGPETEGLPITDPRPLPPNRLQKVEYQLNLRPGNESFVTFSHRIERRRNSYRQMAFTRKDLDFIFWFPLGERGNLSLNHQIQNFSTGVESLKPWLSDLRFTSLHLSYPLSPKLILTPSFYRTAVKGATNTRDTSLLIGLNYPLIPSSEISLQLGFVQFTDRVVRERGFRALLFSADLRRQF